MGCILGSRAHFSPKRCGSLFNEKYATQKLRLSPFLSILRGYAVASSSDDRMNEPPTSLGLVPHQVRYTHTHTLNSVTCVHMFYSRHTFFCSFSPCSVGSYMCVDGMASFLHSSYRSTDVVAIEIKAVTSE